MFCIVFPRITGYHDARPIRDRQESAQSLPFPRKQHDFLALPLPLTRRRLRFFPRCAKGSAGSGNPDETDFAERLLPGCRRACPALRSEEHTSELQSLMRTQYAVFCLNIKTKQ